MANSQPIPTNPRFQDLTGRKFGRWTVVSYEGRRRAAHVWGVVCECGATAVVYGGNLTRGISKSCGCFMRELAVSQSTTHGRTGTSEYKTWTQMVSRCHCPSDKSYSRYGGRGIVVCQRWRESFAAFYEDMGPKPSPKHSIDRINNNGNYEPGNCRWATIREQSRNRRSNRYLTCNGRTMCLQEWANEIGVHHNQLLVRLKKGWSHERTLTEPFKKRRTRQ